MRVCEWGEVCGGGMVRRGMRVGRECGRRERRTSLEPAQQQQQYHRSTPVMVTARDTSNWSDAERKPLTKTPPPISAHCAGRTCPILRVGVEGRVTRASLESLPRCTRGGVPAECRRRGAAGSDVCGEEAGGEGA